jgi:arylsulfatase A-like enzyme
VPKEHFFATWATNNGLDFIRRHKDKPFYVTISYYGPHAPWTPPKPYDTLYSPDSIKLPKNVPDDETDKPALLAEQIVRGKKTPDAAKRNMIAKYYGLVTIIDDQIGRVLKTLDEFGLSDNTVVVFSSDHGEMLGEHHIIGKGFYPYNANTGVTLLVRYPGVVRAGQVSDALIETIDLPQTVLDMAGAPLLENVDGKSFRNVLVGRDQEHRRYVHTAMRHPVEKRGYYGMVATRDHKLFWYHAEGPGAKVLFDLKNDPGEFRNVIDAPAHAKARAELEKEMHRWHRSMNFNPDTYRPPVMERTQRRTRPTRKSSRRPQTSRRTTTK